MGERSDSGGGVSVHTDTVAPLGGDDLTWPTGVVNSILAALSLLLLAGIVLVVLLQVYMRYVVGSPLPWGDEAARLQLVWLTFIGAALAYRLKAHIAVDALSTLFANRGWTRAARVVELLIDLAVVFGATVLLLAGIDLVGATVNQLTPALRIPRAVMYLALPVGTGLIVLSAGAAGVRAILAGRGNRQGPR